MSTGLTATRPDVPTRCRQVAWRRVGEEVVLVPIGARRSDLDSVYLLDEVGAAIWELADGQRSTSDIVDALVEEFEVTRERADSDLQVFLTRLTDIGAMEPEAP